MWVGRRAVLKSGVPFGCYEDGRDSAGVGELSKLVSVGGGVAWPDSASAKDVGVSVAALSTTAPGSPLETGASAASVTGGIPGAAPADFSGFGGRGRGFLAVSRTPLANSMTCP